jgi:hypothetical protein
MSTSDKHRGTIRHGGPGASHENAKKPAEARKPGADDERMPQRSRVSGGGGEADRHHARDPDLED